MKFYSCFIVVLTCVLYGVTSFSAFAAGYTCSSKHYVTCAAGYFLNSSKCLKCPDNSTTVADNKSTTCTCEDGFSLNGKSTGVKTTSMAPCIAFSEDAKAKTISEKKHADPVVITTSWNDQSIETEATTEPKQVSTAMKNSDPIEISKAEMTASGPNGLPCWYNSTPKAYKECVYNTVAGRLNS